MCLCNHYDSMNHGEHELWHGGKYEPVICQTGFYLLIFAIFWWAVVRMVGEISEVVVEEGGVWDTYLPKIHRNTHKIVLNCSEFSCFLDWIFLGFLLPPNYWIRKETNTLVCFSSPFFLCVSWDVFSNYFLGPRSSNFYFAWLSSYPSNPFPLPSTQTYVYLLQTLNSWNYWRGKRIC